MDAQEAKRAQAQLGNAKEQEIYPVTNKKGETILIKEEIKQEHTLFIKGIILLSINCLFVLISVQAARIAPLRFVADAQRL
jgi:hypothetical protein